mmetsp:Transcript_30508/g.59955  ORF Transcript_30508/g.59955 Transcript_30508/m.59955 type:complete len:115 (+) Transcript_30508:270-614(+)
MPGLSLLPFLCFTGRYWSACAFFSSMHRIIIVQKAKGGARKIVRVAQGVERVDANKDCIEAVEATLRKRHRAMKVREVLFRIRSLSGFFSRQPFFRYFALSFGRRPARTARPTR